MTVFNDVCSLHSSAVIHRPSNRKLISCVARYLVGLIVISTWPLSPTRPQCIEMQPFSNSSELLTVSCSHKTFIMITQTVQDLLHWQTDTPTNKHYWNIPASLCYRCGCWTFCYFAIWTCHYHLRRFATWTFQYQDVSLPPWMFRHPCQSL